MGRLARATGVSLLVCLLLLAGGHPTLSGAYSPAERVALDAADLDPRIIEGEARGCGKRAMIAVAHVHANHVAQTGRVPAWYGWTEHPSSEAYWAGVYGLMAPDPTRGARHLWSARDVTLPAVQEIIRDEGLVRLAVFECAWGGSLHAYREAGR